MPDIVVGLTEAESLDLTDGYRVETRGDASGGAVVWISADQVQTTGTATGTFVGQAAIYDVKINYFNESDGEGTWTLFVNGTPVGSFTGEGGGAGLGTPDSETFTVALQDGDTVSVQADQDGGERGRFDSFEISRLGALNVGSNEAEDLILDGGYTVETNNDASGNELVALSPPPGEGSGTVSGEFTGEAGAYDLSVTYFNEADGVGTYDVLVNGIVVGSWQGTGGGAGFGTPDTEIVTVSLNTGDTVSVRGTRGDGELARIDKIDVATAKTINVGRTEAEDLTLDGYAVENKTGTSGGQGIVTETSGTASGIFTGLDGTYSLDVTYLDENDGVSTFAVLVNGVEVDSWLANGAGSGPGVPTVRTVQLDLQAGDQISIQGVRDEGERARVDFVELTAINTGPVTGPDTATADEDGSVTVNVLANDSDPEGSAISLTAINGTAVVEGDTVAVTNASVTVGANGALTVVPDAEFSGEVGFAYTVTDGSFETQGAVTVTVNAVNDAPAAVGDTGSVEEDGSVNLDVLANDTDVEGDALSITAIAGTAVVAGDSVAVANATVTLEADGTLTIAPDTDFDGEIVFDYTASDGAASSNATVALTVGGVNDGLVAVSDTAVTNEDAPVSLDVLGNDIDPDGDPLSVTEIAGTPVAAGDTVDVGAAQVTLETDGRLTVTPDANVSGEVSFTYTVSDGAITDDGSVTVAVAPVNDAPVAGDDTLAVNEDGSASVDVLANDSDAEGANLIVTAIAGAPVAAGDTVDVGNAQVTLEADGTLTVVPDADFNGELSFAYTVFDGAGSDNGSVSVSVAPVNDAPLAADDTADTTEDSPVSVDVLANDSDPDGDKLNVTAVAGQAIAPGGSVDVGDGTVSLGEDGKLNVQPDNGFDGAISFEYTASDGAATTKATVSVGVEGVIADATQGDDTINGTSGDNTISSVDGNDDIFGNAGDDTLFSGNGNDLVAGGGGDDLISGGNGNDDLRGGSGIDTLLGGNGDDRLRVGADNDFGFGGDGEDFLQGAGGDDSLFGEADNDVLYGGIGVDWLNGGEGDDELRAGSSGDTLEGGDGNDTLLAQSGDDAVTGGVGDDLLNGAAGDDTLLGEAGNDELNGGSGIDLIDGGLGDDILKGQDGLDTFVFDADEDGTDTVIDYENGETILLRDFGYASASDAALDFSQVGNDVVFQKDGNTVTFQNTTLFSLFDGIEVEGAVDTAPASEDIGRLEAPSLDALFEMSLVDEDGGLA